MTLLDKYIKVACTPIMSATITLKEFEETCKKLQSEEEINMLTVYNYDEAVRYLEDKGICCDPCQSDEAEYVCNWLEKYYTFCDEWNETWYTKELLDKLVEELR